MITNNIQKTTDLLAKRKTVFPIIIIAIMLCSCNVKPKITFQPPTSEDTCLLTPARIDEILNTPSVYRTVRLKDPDLSIDLPYNYGLDSKSGLYIFYWRLCDLIIDSDSSNYNYVDLTGAIPYKGYNGLDGKLHLVGTEDSLAVSTEKFKSMHEEDFDQILYSDENSVVFTARDRFYTFYFKYLNKLKAFAVYVNEEKALGFEASPQELFDLSLTKLRMAKNLFQTHKNTAAFTWQDYKNTLSTPEYRLFDGIRKQLHDSINLPKSDELFSTTLEGHQRLVSMIKNPETLAALQQSFDRIPKNRFVPLKSIFKSEHVENISYLRGDYDEIRVAYKDGQGLILEKSVYNYSWFSVYYFTAIQSQPVLLFTGNYANTQDIHEKDLAFLYFRFFQDGCSELELNKSKAAPPQ